MWRGRLRFFRPGAARGCSPISGTAEVLPGIGGHQTVDGVIKSNDAGSGRILSGICSQAMASSGASSGMERHHVAQPVDGILLLAVKRVVFTKS